MKVLLCALALLSAVAAATLAGAETADRLLWERISGTVEAVEPSMVKVRDDGGRILKVTTDALSASARGKLAVGEQVEIIGPAEPNGAITARYVDHGTRPAALPREALPIRP